MRRAGDQPSKLDHDASSWLHDDSVGDGSVARAMQPPDTTATTATSAARTSGLHDVVGIIGAVIDMPADPSSNRTKGVRAEGAHAAGRRARKERPGHGPGRS